MERQYQETYLDLLADNFIGLVCLKTIFFMFTTTTTDIPNYIPNCRTQPETASTYEMAHAWQ